MLVFLSWNNLSLKKFLNIIVFIQLFVLLPLSSANEEDGQVTFYVHHSLELGPVPNYTPRGVIHVYSLKNGDASFHQNKPLSGVEIAKLKRLSSEGGIYRLKISTKADENNSYSVFTFTKACSIYESALSDIITLMLDQNESLLSVAISTYPPQCSGVLVPDSKLSTFNTSVTVVSVVNGPVPDTQIYIQRLEQEKMEKARGEQGDNRSFFAKYWMYFVPLIIFLLISGASGPEGQGGGR